MKNMIIGVDRCDVCGDEQILILEIESSKGNMIMCKNCITHALCKLVQPSPPPSPAPDAALLAAAKKALVCSRNTNPLEVQFHLERAIAQAETAAGDAQSGDDKLVVCCHSAVCDIQCQRKQPHDKEYCPGTPSNCQYERRYCRPAGMSYSD